MIRQLIREMLLQEAMLTPQKAAAEDLTFSVRRTRYGKGGWSIECRDTKSNIPDYPEGTVRMQRSLGIGKCSGAYEVTLADVHIDGLGPLLYDIAMELAGDAGIMSDREMVSPEARNVWQYYQKNRSDVEHSQLDSNPGTLTPYDEEDDCKQVSATFYSPDSERKAFATLRQGGEWKTSPLSKVYKKRGTPTIDKLKELGIIEIDDNEPAPVKLNFT